jgi:serine/threonine protein kinase
MAHCDVKPSNFMVNRNLLVKTSGLGEAYIYMHTYEQLRNKLSMSEMDNHVPDCTLPYTPPECLLPKLNYKSYSHKIDVHSFGVLLMELIF